MEMIEEFIGDMIARVMAQNVIAGIAEFDKHYFPMPVRCRARHWMKRGEARVDLYELFPDILDGEE
jgi:hypothetical protein